MSGEMITIDGVEYTKEDYNKAKELFNEVWNSIKEAFSNIMSNILSVVRKVINYIKNNAPVGYKRFFKNKQLGYFESISEGKSNNWRKNHGLPLERGINRKPLNE